VLVIGTSGRVEARLVDFELAQDRSTQSPGHVNLSVEKLYRERNVPFNPQAGWYTKNLDQHLIGEAIQMIEQLAARLNGIIDADAPFRSLSSIGPFYSGLEVRIPSPRTHLRRGETHPAPPSGRR